MHTARGGLLGCLATIALPIAKVYTGHSWRFEQKTNRIARFLFRLYEQYICHCSTLVTFLTQRDLHLGLHLRLIKQHKAIAINTRIAEPKEDTLRLYSRIVTRTAYGIPENAQVIGNTGYLSDRKDPYTFVKAAARIAVDIPHAHFLWVGDGEIRPEVERLVRQLGLTRCFTITGFKPAEQIPLFLQLIDVLLFTSRIEGVPFTLLEAQLSGLPVVSSAYPGVQEIVEHGFTGFTFSPGDARQAADRVVDLLSDNTLLTTMAESALASARERHSDAAKMAGQYQQIYFDAIRYALNA
jgi:glycosyltransferase involved in cell wall biosynthesis